jgi:hypothetical protein
METTTRATGTELAIALILRTAEHEGMAREIRGDRGSVARAVGELRKECARRIPALTLARSIQLGAHLRRLRVNAQWNRLDWEAFSLGEGIADRMARGHDVGELSTYVDVFCGDHEQELRQLGITRDRITRRVSAGLAAGHDQWRFVRKVASWIE